MINEQSNQNVIRIDYRCSCFWIWDDDGQRWYPTWCDEHEKDVIKGFDQLMNRRIGNT